MKSPAYPFLLQAGSILNSGQSRSILLTGNIYDLFHAPGTPGVEAGRYQQTPGVEAGRYQSLIDFLVAHWQVPDLILVIYELNGPIRFARESDLEKIKDAWLRWRTGLSGDDIAIKKMLGSKEAAMAEVYKKDFDQHMQSAVGNPTLALELLRQMCLCSRMTLDRKSVLPENLLILIEAADLIIPEAPITSLRDADRHRMSICQDWFSDPGFVSGGDCVVLIAESASLVNARVARLPQVLEVEIPAPDEDERKHFISWFMSTCPEADRPALWSSEEELAACTAGLTIQALLQLLKGAAHRHEKLTQAAVVAKVEEYIQSQLGEDIVEFKKPTHTLADVVGFAKLKAFIKDEMIPRLGSRGDDALPGAAVCGPIGGGKTFIFEAMASELNMVVLVLKNIRSQWFGQTDVLFERLRRVLEALSHVLIFVDEADTQFGGVGIDEHSTERRLTGKIQAMMSDTRLRGRVTWLLMTARIHLLSPDIRRPGRVGDLIIPILDPEGEDRKEFLAWAVKPVLKAPLDDASMQRLDAATKDYAAANFAAVRSELKARAKQHGGSLELADILAVVEDLIPPAIGPMRRYQALQALVNCTRRSLLPNPKVTDDERAAWSEEIRGLELKGIR